ncbi:hypothetical protein KY330_01800 [Candidatus Woesearchaeota archaeon]|nr:hypothetical protein [Candidatus Woesearchaeota archaeon]
MNISNYVKTALQGAALGTLLYAATAADALTITGKDFVEKFLPKAPAKIQQEYQRKVNLGLAARIFNADRALGKYKGVFQSALKKKGYNDNKFRTDYEDPIGELQVKGRDGRPGKDTVALSSTDSEVDFDLGNKNAAVRPYNSISGKPSKSYGFNLNLAYLNKNEMSQVEQLLAEITGSKVGSGSSSSNSAPSAGRSSVVKQGDDVYARLKTRAERLRQSRAQRQQVQQDKPATYNAPAPEPQAEKQRLAMVGLSTEENGRAQKNLEQLLGEKSTSENREVSRRPFNLVTGLRYILSVDGDAKKKALLGKMKKTKFIDPTVTYRHLIKSYFGNGKGEEVDIVLYPVMKISQEELGSRGLKGYEIDEAGLKPGEVYEKHAAVRISTRTGKPSEWKGLKNQYFWKLIKLDGTLFPKDLLDLIKDKVNSAKQIQWGILPEDLMDVARAYDKIDQKVRTVKAKKKRDAKGDTFTKFDEARAKIRLNLEDMLKLKDPETNPAASKKLYNTLNEFEKNRGLRKEKKLRDNNGNELVDESKEAKQFLETIAGEELREFGPRVPGVELADRSILNTKFYKVGPDGKFLKDRKGRKILTPYGLAFHRVLARSLRRDTRNDYRMTVNGKKKHVISTLHDKLKVLAGNIKVTGKRGRRNASEVAMNIMDDGIDKKEFKTIEDAVKAAGYKRLDEKTIFEIQKAMYNAFSAYGRKSFGKFMNNAFNPVKVVGGFVRSAKNIRNIGDALLVLGDGYTLLYRPLHLRSSKGHSKILKAYRAGRGATAVKKMVEAAEDGRAVTASGHAAHLLFMLNDKRRPTQQDQGTTRWLGGSEHGEGSPVGPVFRPLE